MRSPDRLLDADRPCVLVVDDTPQSLRFVTTALEAEGMTVLIAPDGHATLELLQDVVPDLILMDAMMPGMDGFETTRRIKKDPALSHVPVIFMTGLTETEHVVRGLEAGGVDYVHKPVVVDELIARVRVHLRNARAARASHQALDFGRRPTIGVSAAGVLRWHTPEAAAALSSCFPQWQVDDRLPEPLCDVLVDLGTQRPLVVRRTLDVAEGRLECVVVGTMDDGSMCVTLLLRRPGEEERLLGRRHNLTTREAEVLLWISRGKPNRDVSEILNISPRTVNKHLEQIFAKLGVENRASAAAIAVTTLNE
ncbi:response regulator transcription factor [Gluconacetobacter johannae]|uniref:Response regulator transcription factor n=1 Tax=Gluconacetobacter johannae TaxID=112140 RepID=A0A7W4J5Z8_9PROT|nr:response regulator transcription factor [Gluconacetobacter johannae]MBB2175236.1 response regulator transcription factor [Gluconacetobacter johannae]